MISNTALLYERGSTGVNVEANPALLEEFNKRRPRDKNLCVGVRAQPGVSTFFMLDGTSGRNTFSPQEALEIEQQTGTKITRKEQLQVVTMNHIVREHCGGRFPEFLSLDTEGDDYEILEGAAFGQTRPLVICVEVRKHEAARMKDCLANWDYFPLIRCGENLIFVQERYRQLLT